MHHELILLLAGLSLGAAALAWLLTRLGLSPILGYILLGALAAPLKGGMALAESTVEQVSEIGLILLLFFLGIEFHLSHARQALRVGLIGGGGQMLLCAGAAYLGAHVAGLGPTAGVAIGLITMYSSTALVMKAFDDRRENDTPRARVALSVLLMQDLAAILAVVLLPALASDNGGSGGEAASLGTTLQRFALLLVLVPALFWLSRRLLPWLFGKLAAGRHAEVFSLFALAACFTVALAAETLGASLALGAFLGGLVLCETPFAWQVRADLATMRNLALAFFFVTVGLGLDLNFVWQYAGWLLLALVATVLLKTLATAGALRLAGTPLPVAGGAALALAQVGEFAFVVAKVAERMGLIDGKAYLFILSLTVLTMLVTPFQVALSGQLAAALNRVFKAPTSAARSATLAAVKSPAGKAVVVGYGPAGQTITRILHDFDIFPTVVDLNPKTVEALRHKGTRALYGDAGRREVLEAAGLKEARFLVVTLPDTPGRLAVIAQARAMSPDVRILTRARYLQERAFLEEAGAQNISFEEGEVAVRLARALLSELSVPPEAIQKEEERIREEIGG